MRRKRRTKANLHKQVPTERQFTSADVRLMLSSPVYAYGINLLPAQRVAEEVMKLNVQLAQEMRETGIIFTLDDLDQRFQALLQRLEDTGICSRGDPLLPVISKEQ